MPVTVIGSFWTIYGFLLLAETTYTRECCEKDWKNMLVPEDYNKFEAPSENENYPTDVYFGVVIAAIHQILEEKMEISMTFVVNEYWKDKRLNQSYMEKNIRKRVPRDWVSDLWLPDTIFENSKGGWIYPLSVPNMAVKIKRFGYLHRFTRYNMNFSCKMLLHSFPMDSQHCSLIISTLGYDSSNVLYRWIRDRPEDTEGIEDLYLYDLNLLKYEVANFSTTSAIVLYDAVNWSVLHANLTFVRLLSSHIVNVYIPSALVVLLSFLSFWLDVKAVPARVALGLTSLLTMSTQASQARDDLPPINYLTALDIWLFVCVMLVFFSLVEYALVYNAVNTKNGWRKSAHQSCISKVWASPSGRLIITREEDKKKSTYADSAAKQGAESHPDEEEAQTANEVLGLDRVSRVLFPLVFVLFAFVYWIKYLNIV